MFGHTPEEWSNAINKYYEQYNQEQKPMTRKEAEKKVSEVEGINLDAAKWIRVFEALGLLKFDEEVTPLSIIQSHFESIRSPEPSTKAKSLLNNLIRCGYKIVRNQD